MKTRIYIIILFCIATMTAFAQTFSAKPIENTPIQSQQIMSTGANYNGTVYEPFSNTTPSEYTEGGSGASYSPAKAPGYRKDFVTPGDYGEGPSPIGDAMLPLLMMAVVFCGAIYFRRKRAAQKS